MNGNAARLDRVILDGESPNNLSPFIEADRAMKPDGVVEAGPAEHVPRTGRVGRDGARGHVRSDMTAMAEACRPGSSGSCWRVRTHSGW